MAVAMGTVPDGDMFSPDEVKVSILHVIKPILSSQRHCSSTRSLPVRIGPLEFRVEATMGTAYAIPHHLVSSVECYSLPVGFPWSGKVEAWFEFLEADGKLIKCWGPRKTALLSSDHQHDRVLQSKGAISLKKCVKDNSLHLSASLMVSCLKVKAGVGGGKGWGIPRALIEQPYPACKPTPPTFWDVVLVSRDGREFPDVHQMILSEYSEVFRTMFATDMKESSERVVRIEDMGRKAVGLMLRFFYSGHFKEEIENLKEYSVEDFLEVVKKFTDRKHAKCQKMLYKFAYLKIVKPNLKEKLSLVIQSIDKSPRLIFFKVCT